MAARGILQATFQWYLVLMAKGTALALGVILAGLIACSAQAEEKKRYIIDYLFGDEGQPPQNSPALYPERIEPASEPSAIAPGLGPSQQRQDERDYQDAMEGVAKGVKENGKDQSRLPTEVVVTSDAKRDFVYGVLKAPPFKDQSRLETEPTLNRDGKRDGGGFVNVPNFAKDQERVAFVISIPPPVKIPVPRAKPIRALLSPPPIKKGPPKILRTRYGGEMLVHVNEATRMLSSGDTFRVRGDQYSAAAMQVLFIKSQAPDRICAERKAKLHFHLPYNPRTKKPDKEADWAFIAFVRPENFQRLGKIPMYGKGWKTVKAVDYLGACKKKAVTCNVVGCGG